MPQIWRNCSKTLESLFLPLPEAKKHSPLHRGRCHLSPRGSEKVVAKFLKSVEVAHLWLVRCYWRTALTGCTSCSVHLLFRQPSKSCDHVDAYCLSYLGYLDCNSDYYGAGNVLQDGFGSVLASLFNVCTKLTTRKTFMYGRCWGRRTNLVNTTWRHYCFKEILVGGNEQVHWQRSPQSRSFRWPGMSVHQTFLPSKSSKRVHKLLHQPSNRASYFFPEFWLNFGHFKTLFFCGHFSH